MELETPFFKILAIVAHILELITIMYAAIYGFLKKSKSVTGFMISRFITALVKSAAILFISIYIAKFCEIFYYCILWTLKPNITMYYWERSYEIQHVLAYFIYSVFTLTIIWILGSFIWTGSFNQAKLFINFFLPQNKQLSLNHFKTLIIINAKYGGNSIYIDVTDKLKKMVQGNTLTITASNELAGDPIFGIAKKLIINYKYEGEDQKTIEIDENDSKTLQPS